MSLEYNARHEENLKDLEAAMTLVYPKNLDGLFENLDDIIDININYFNKEIKDLEELEKSVGFSEYAQAMLAKNRAQLDKFIKGREERRKIKENGPKE